MKLQTLVCDQCGNSHQFSGEEDLAQKGGTWCEYTHPGVIYKEIAGEQVPRGKQKLKKDFCNKDCEVIYAKKVARANIVAEASWTEQMLSMTRSDYIGWKADNVEDLIKERNKLVRKCEFQQQEIQGYRKRAPARDARNHTLERKNSLYRKVAATSVAASLILAAIAGQHGVFVHETSETQHKLASLRNLDASANAEAVPVLTAEVLRLAKIGSKTNKSADTWWCQRLGSTPTKQGGLCGETICAAAWGHLVESGATVGPPQELEKKKPEKQVSAFRRGIKKSGIPSDLIETLLTEVPLNTVVFVVPWAVSIDTNGKAWITPSHHVVSERSSGTSVMPVLRVKNLKTNKIEYLVSLDFKYGPSGKYKWTPKTPPYSGDWHKPVRFWSKDDGWDRLAPQRAGQ